jgi:hypothetical protein
MGTELTYQLRRSPDMASDRAATAPFGVGFPSMTDEADEAPVVQAPTPEPPPKTQDPQPAQDPSWVTFEEVRSRNPFSSEEDVTR